MVVEFLTFRVPPEDRSTWLQIEAAHWTRFLERQPGFVRKEMWTPIDDPEVVHAVIWWESIELWKAIPAEALAAVAAAMGEHERGAVCDTFEVLRAG